MLPPIAAIYQSFNTVIGQNISFDWELGTMLGEASPWR
jgi:hypothetical protein